MFTRGWIIAVFCLLLGGCENRGPLESDDVAPRFSHALPPGTTFTVVYVNAYAPLSPELEPYEVLTLEQPQDLDEFGGCGGPMRFQSQIMFLTPESHHTLRPGQGLWTQVAVPPGTRLHLRRDPTGCTGTFITFTATVVSASDN